MRAKTTRGEKTVNILVVDDEEDLCWMIKKALRSSGFMIRSVNSGSQALVFLAKKKYKVAFVDAKLPDMDGLSLSALIRHQSPGTSIILISGYYYPEDKIIVEGLEKNTFIGFIAKPFDLNEIRQQTYLAVDSSK